MIATVFLLLVASQVTIQFFLFKQNNRGRLINIAGKQRMLSQRLAKYAILLKADPENTAHLKNFNESFVQFTKAHENLSNLRSDLDLNVKNSTEIQQLFTTSTSCYQVIKIEGAKIIKEKGDFDIAKLLKAEESFLPIMDQIVKHYDLETDDRNRFISILEYILFFFTIVVLILELLIVLLPLEKEIVVNYEKIAQQNQKLKLINERVKQLYSSLLKRNCVIQKGKEELEAQNEEIISLINTLDEQVKSRTAILTYQNEKFKEYAHLNSHKVRGPLSRILGLISILNLDSSLQEKETFEGFIKMFKTSTHELDDIIKEMNNVLKEAQFYKEGDPCN